jgi:hypothetical protein
MSNNHLTDTEIQLSILDREACSVEMLEHFSRCEECKAKAAQYLLIFDEIRSQTIPTFDFNLSETVIKEIQKDQQFDIFDRYFLISAVAVVILTGVILFFLFRNYLSSAFMNIQPLSVGLILTTMVSLLSIIGFDSAIKYLRQVQKLNFY